MISSLAVTILRRNDRGRLPEVAPFFSSLTLPSLSLAASSVYRLGTGQLDELYLIKESPLPNSPGILLHT